MEVTLERWADSPDGMFGTLRVGRITLMTVERPWKDNIPSVSAIPPGTYPLKLGMYNHGGYKAYELVMPDDSPRGLIKIHRANTMDELKGCIGLGVGRGYLAPKADLPKRWAVTDSRKALEMFMYEMAGAETGTIKIFNTDSLSVKEK